MRMHSPFQLSQFQKICDEARDRVEELSDRIAEAQRLRGLAYGIRLVPSSSDWIFDHLPSNS